MRRHLTYACSRLSICCPNKLIHLRRDHVQHIIGFTGDVASCMLDPGRSPGLTSALIAHSTVQSEHVHIIKNQQCWVNLDPRCRLLSHRDILGAPKYSFVDRGGGRFQLFGVLDAGVQGLISRGVGYDGMKYTNRSDTK